MPNLIIDFETFSAADLKQVGGKLYAQHPTTGVHCMGYTLADDDAPKLWVRGEPIPPEILEYVEGGGTIYAWNAPFEIAIWNELLHPREGWPYVPLEQWHCLMAQSACWGLPLGLDAAAKFVGLDHHKDKEGHRLMLQVAKPRKLRPLTFWHEDPDAWPEKRDRLHEYCLQDLVVERAMLGPLPPMPANERRIWLLDQEINDRGVQVDVDLALNARELAADASARSDEEVRQVSNGEVSSVRAVAALRRWIEGMGVELPPSLDKHTVPSLLLRDDIPAPAKRVLEHRVLFSKSSTAKFTAIVEGSAGGRMYGILQYCAAHTGRWGGRRLQPQNLPRAVVRDLEYTIDRIMARDVDGLEVLDGPLMDILTRMVRPTIKAKPGHKLLVADYSAIEARVLAWMAGQAHLVEIFREGGDVYLDMASRIYERPVTKADKKERQLGKTAILGLGYGMGKAKFFETCQLQGVDVDEDLAVYAVDTYREANHAVVAWWHALDAAARDAINNYPGTTFQVGMVAFAMRGSNLLCQLPSGRKLMYAYAEIGSRWIKFVDEDGVEQERERHGVIYQSGTGYHVMWGGIWAENIVQAVARDLLADALLRIDAAGFPIVLHVHDEIVAEVPEDSDRLDEFCALMAETPSWAAGCPIDVEGGEMLRYGKP